MFSDRPGGSWVWQDNVLKDSDGHVLADMRVDVLNLGKQRMLVEVDSGVMSFRMRATHSSGAVFKMEQPHFTVQVLTANCAGRRYRLRRHSLWSKDRLIVADDGHRAVEVKPRLDGRVEVTDGPDGNILPFADVVFMSWGCVLVDSPARDTRM